MDVCSTMRYETNVANGVTNIEFDRKDIEMNKMGITTLESKFRVFDMRTQHPTVCLFASSCYAYVKIFLCSCIVLYLYVSVSESVCCVLRKGLPV